MNDSSHTPQAPARTYEIPRQRIALVQDGSLRSTWEQFTRSWDVFVFAREQLFADADREMFYVLMLDSHNRLIGANLASLGSLSTGSVSVPNVFKAAILANAAYVIVLHNHPSGCPLPSQADREITTRLHEAGKILEIEVLDHVVVGQAGYFSFADEHLLKR